MSYEEIEGRMAIAKSNSFVFNFKLQKLQEQIARQELAIKKLREAKWQKLCEDVKPTYLDTEVNVSVHDLQSFLQNKKFVAKKSTLKRKISSKKIGSD